MSRPVDRDYYDYDRVADDGAEGEDQDGDEDADCGWEDVYASFGCSTGIED